MVERTKSTDHSGYPEDEALVFSKVAFGNKARSSRVSIGQLYIHRCPFALCVMEERGCFMDIFESCCLTIDLLMETRRARYAPGSLRHDQSSYEPQDVITLPQPSIHDQSTMFRLTIAPVTSG